MSIEERVRELNGGTYTKKSYSVEEVQAILGITRQTVYKLIKQGCFQAVMLETGYRIIKTSLAVLGMCQYVCISLSFFS